MSLTKKIVILLLLVCGAAMSINGIIENNRISSKLSNEAKIFHSTLLKNSAIGLGRAVFEVQEELTEIMISSLFKTESVQSVRVFNMDGSFFMGLVRDQGKARTLEEEEWENLEEENLDRRRNLDFFQEMSFILFLFLNLLKQSDL